MTKVLLVEDDEEIARSLSAMLREHGREVLVADRGLKGLEHVVDDNPDVIVLDLGLPDVDGLEILKMIRGYGNIPVIVATARDDEHVIVRALDLGADDYVVKPFSGEHLNARIRALLRRGRAAKPGPVSVGELRVDVAAREASLGGVDLELRRKEFDLLAALAERVGEVVTRRELATEVWGDPLLASDATIDFHVSSLRRALGESAAEPRYINAIRGVGLKLVDPGP